MNFCQQLKRIERIDRLIRSRATGTPAELAYKLGLSQSQLFQTIKIMKEDLHAPICYSKYDRCYFYSEKVKFICSYESEVSRFSSKKVLTPEKAE